MEEEPFSLQTPELRTTVHLNNFLDEQISWRKKELTHVKLLIDSSNEAPLSLNVLLRCGIVILYAHWEGFLKYAATSYVKYVSFQRHNCEELTANFVSLAMKKELNKALSTNKATIYVEVANLFITGLSMKANIMYDDAIHTKSNLNSEVLREIMCIMGFDYSYYAPKEHLIDARLLKNRNEVAHGKELTIDKADYNDIHLTIISLMDNFKKQVIDGAIQKAYLR